MSSKECACAAIRRDDFKVKFKKFVILLVGYSRPQR